MTEIERQFQGEWIVDHRHGKIILEDQFKLCDEIADNRWTQLFLEEYFRIHPEQTVKLRGQHGGQVDLEGDAEAAEGDRAQDVG